MLIFVKSKGNNNAPRMMLRLTGFYLNGFIFTVREDRMNNKKTRNRASVRVLSKQKFV